MPKVTIEYDLDDYDKDDKRALKLAMKANDMSLAFFDIHQQVWRPYYKHGYPGRLQEIIDRNHIEVDGNSFEGTNDVLDAIELLHEMYLDVLREYDVGNDD